MNRIIAIFDESTANRSMVAIVAATSLAIITAALLGWLINSWTVTSSWPAVFYIIPSLVAFGFCAHANPLLLLELIAILPLAWILSHLHTLMNLVQWSLGPASALFSWLIVRFGKAPDSRAVITRLLEDRAIQTSQAEMLIGVVDLHDMNAGQVMTAKPALDFISPSAGVEEALDICQMSGHGRLPVLSGPQNDDVVGMVYLHDLIVAYRNRDSLADKIQEALIVPEDYSLDKLIAYLKTERKTVAMVVDEYGRAIGMVTIEDIVEEIVGEIDDETDKPFHLESRIFVPGHISIDDLPELLSQDRPPVNSLGGLVFHLLGHLPSRGESVDYNRHRLTVTALAGNRISQVKVEKIDD